MLFPEMGLVYDYQLQDGGVSSDNDNDDDDDKPIEVCLALTKLNTTILFRSDVLSYSGISRPANKCIVKQSRPVYLFD